MRFSPGFAKIVALSSLAVFWTASKALADVFNMPAGQTSLSLVTVGDPGNAADPTTGLGAVPYTYKLGTYDITAFQYIAFLNAVAATDPYGLYNPSMAPGSTAGTPGIIQAGSSGNYSYSVVSGNGNLPINIVSWGDAARFCNWLSNGQPATGVENASTTEDGSYALNGAVTDGQLDAVTRTPNATYVIPTENEWYKAAYYKSGSTNAGYWLFPTQSNTPPSNVLSATGTNNANFFDPVLGLSDSATELSPVGAFSSSPSAYGAFDMGGDVYQWNSTLEADGFGLRGGSFFDPYSDLQSDYGFSAGGSQYGTLIGFRIAEVPEPSSISILAIGAIGLLRRRRRR